MRVSNRRKLTTVLAAVAAVSIFASAAFAARLAGEDRWETAAERCICRDGQRYRLPSSV